MKFFDYFEKVEIFNRLVEQSCTGTPDEFCKRLGISRTFLYDFIAELRSKNVLVAYSRTRQTFYFKNQVSIETGFKVNHLEPVNESEAKNISGGYQFFSSVLFSGWKRINFVAG
jgi:hypothetical protein